MRIKEILLVTGVACGLLLMAGCGAEQAENPQDPDAAADYQAEARESIQAENMDDYLEELEGEITRDEAESDQ